jgi:3-oxoadipate enol-lactonase
MPAGWPSIAGMAEDVLLVLDQLTIDSAHVVGLSLGGAVALRMAARAPERVRSLVAVNAFARLRRPRGSMGRWASRVWLALTGRMDQLGRLVAAGLFPLAEQEAMRTLAAARLSGNPAMNYVKLLTAVSRFDLRPQLAQIRTPTLIVAGEQDATVPIECKLELARSIRGARFVRIPESGHATPLDQPQRFNAVLLEFLDGVEHGPNLGLQTH